MAQRAVRARKNHGLMMSWAEAERHYSRPLTPREVVETFPHEARELAPRCLALMKGALRAYYRAYIAPAVQRARPEDRPIVELLVTTLWPNCEVVSELTKRILHLQRIVAELRRKSNAREQKEKLGHDAVEKAKKYPLEELCRHYGVVLRRTGRLLQGCCPFHEDRTPSFVVYPDNRWYCFACNEGGDTIEFLRQMEGLSFVEAVRRLAT